MKIEFDTDNYQTHQRNEKYVSVKQSILKILQNSNFTFMDAHTLFADILSDIATQNYITNLVD